MKNISYILFLLGLIGCNTVDNKNPLINENKMENILYDLHITEAYVSQLSLNSNNTIDSLSYYKQLVFDKHNIDETTFNQSMEYYTDHPEILEKIYNNLRKDIQKKDEQIPHINENENSNKSKKENIITPKDSLLPFSNKKTP